MTCSRCQQENPPHARFCLACGARLGAVCARCAAELAPGARFCSQCGHEIAVRPGVEPRFASPGAYTPKHLAERILTSKAALEGERKQVTVLFADLKGSMELLADRDPEEARKILDPILELMMDAVHRYEGTVNQVMGDGIMALFGAPIAHEDHAVRACYAALGMQESVRQYAEDIQRRAGVPIQIRVGLNSGEVVVRSIGSDLHMDYTAVGQTTHLAARMEQMAMAGSILVSADTLMLAEDYVRVKGLGPVRVKGLSEPVEVYEVLGAGAVRTRLQRSVAHGLTRFVGRDAELDHLRHALDQASQGRGQVVAVVGEPGVGKSRLFYEFLHSHRTHGWLILEASSVSYGRATAYLPVIDLLKTYLKVGERDDTRAIRAKVTGALLTLDEALKDAVPPILALLEALPDDDPFRGLEPDQRRRRTRDAVRRLLLRESQVQSLVLVFEDLHWIDTETLSALDALVESVPTVPVLLLVNYRPEHRHSWNNKTYYRQLRVDPLPLESAEELLAALLGGGAGLLPLKRLLIDRTEGNPLFLEETVRSLVETEVLVGERGGYRLARPLEALQVPATVQAILAARIDRLGPEDKRLLQAASVIGKDVSFALLQAIAEMGEDELRQGLARLQAGEFVYEARLFPDLEYTFKHALTHDVAYAGVLQDRRRALHGVILTTLERVYRQRLVEHAATLAHHALRGERWAEALGYFRETGAKALGRGAPREALACFEQALVALGHLPEEREVLEQAIDLRLELRNTLTSLGEHERGFSHLQEAAAFAQRLGDQPRLGRTYGRMAGHFWVVGDSERALETANRALAVADALGDVALQAETNYTLGYVLNAVGAPRRATDFLTKSVALLQGDLIRERPALRGPAVSSRTWLGMCLVALGRFAEAVAVQEEARALAETHGLQLGLPGTYQGIGLAYLSKGELPRAIAAFERGLELCRNQNNLVWFPSIATALGRAYALAGRVEEGIALIEEAVREAPRNPADEATSLAALASSYLAAGRRAEALPLARRALDIARQRKQRRSETTALLTLGEIACHGDSPEVETATDCYRRLIVLAEEMELRPAEARGRLGLGSLYRRVRQPSEAREQLARALALFREMEMDFWQARAEEELGHLEDGG